MLKVELIPGRDILVKGKSNSLEVLVKVSTKKDYEREKHPRLPLNIGLALDRSGSMAGLPLEEAKKCAKMLIDRMHESDRISLVVFDGEVDVLAESQPVGDKVFLKSRVDSIEHRGMTALYDGWSVAADQIGNYANSKTLSRVLLLSDGCANEGLTDLTRISHECALQSRLGITTSTYGLGRHFNEALMTEMARHGEGMAHYGQSAEDLIDPFTEEFDLISSLIARKLKLRVRTEAGVRIELLNDFRSDRFGQFLLPDLAEAGQAWAMFRIFIDPELCKNKVGTNLKILSAKVSCVDLDGHGQESEWANLSLKLSTADLVAEIPIQEEVNQRSLELQAARIYDRARGAARAGDWDTVNQLMEDLKTLGKNNAWIDASIEKINKYARERQQEFFAKEASYRSSKMRRRLTSNDEVSYSLRSEQMKPSYLRRKPEQGKHLGR